MVNEFFHCRDSGLTLFLGHEPEWNVELYAEAFLDAVEELGVVGVVALAGVEGVVPYDMDREVSCICSVAEMGDELRGYAVKLGEYEGPARIGTYLVERARARGLKMGEVAVTVPRYDFALSLGEGGVLSATNDYKGWYDLVVRLNDMMSLGLDLGRLREAGEEFIEAWDERLEEIGEEYPEVGVEGYLEEVRAGFEEMGYVSLSDEWREGLEGLLGED